MAALDGVSHARQRGLDMARLGGFMPLSVSSPIAEQPLAERAAAEAAPGSSLSLGCVHPTCQEAVESEGCQGNEVYRTQR